MTNKFSSSRLGFLIGVGLAGSAAMGVSSCTGKPAAGLVVAIETDVPLPKDVDTIEVQVEGDGALQFDNTYPVGFGQLLIPATLTLLPGSTPDEPFTIRLLAYRGSEVRMLRETVTSIPTTRVAWLRLPIQWLSFGMESGGSPTSPDKVQSTCKSGQTPDNGTCIDDAVDSTILPDYDAGSIFGGGDGTGSGKCYDLLKCFASSTTQAVETSGCTLDDPGGSRVNVAMETEQSGGDGQCGPQGCLIPLASGGSGWTRTKGKLALPKAVCARLKSGKLTHVRVSTSCPSATEDAPLCGPWSSVAAASADAGTESVAGCGTCTLAKGQANPSGIAVDSTNVYWTDQGSSTGSNGTVMKVGLGGGDSTTVATGQSVPVFLALDSTSVYWTDFGDNPSEGAVVKAPIGGGTPMTLASTQESPYAIAVDSANVYWVDRLPGTVMQVPLGGGTITTLATGQTLASGIAADGTNVYWTGFDGTDTTVMQIPVGGGRATTLAKGQSTSAIAVDGTNVYWTDQGTGAGDGTVAKVAIGGGTATTLAKEQSSPVAIAVDPESVYWLNGGTDGTVMSVPLRGGTPTTLASGQDTPTSIAVNGGSVYWANHGGTVMELALTGSRDAGSADAGNADASRDGSMVVKDARGDDGSRDSTIPEDGSTTDAMESQDAPVDCGARGCAYTGAGSASAIPLEFNAECTATGTGAGHQSSVGVGGYAFWFNDGTESPGGTCTTSPTTVCLDVNSLCISGTTGIANVSQNCYGGGLGFLVNQPITSDGGTFGTYSVPSSSKGITYSLSNFPAIPGGRVYIQVVTGTATPSTTNEYAAYITAASGTVAWTSLTLMVYATTPGTALTGPPSDLQQVVFGVNDGTAPTSFDFCVNSVTF